VPAGTKALLLPAKLTVGSAYVNGKKVMPQNGRIRLANLDFREPQVLALKMAGVSELESFLRFETGETDYHLGSWTRTGLSYYVGSASYERDFDLAPQLAGNQILLDCGDVGVALEIQLNGQKAGTRLWEPYSLDVTKFLKPGRNHLKITVTNASDGTMRGVPDFRRYLELLDLTGVFLSSPGPFMDVIDLNGLIGPVRLLPYRDAQLSTRK
jgi:hypothetical protein